MVKFYYCCCLLFLPGMPAAFTQPGASTLAGPCTILTVPICDQVLQWFPSCLLSLPVPSKLSIAARFHSLLAAKRIPPTDRPPRGRRGKGERATPPRVLRSLGRKSRGVHSFVNSAAWMERRRFKSVHRQSLVARCGISSRSALGAR